VEEDGHQAAQKPNADELLRVEADEERRQGRARRAGKVEGLGDEIALFRAELKRAIEEEGDNLKVLSDGVKTLARAVTAHKKVFPETGGFLERHEQALIAMEESLNPVYDERRRAWAEIQNAEFRAKLMGKPAYEESDSAEPPADG